MNPNPKRIMDMTCAFMDSCVLFAASDLGIFDKLAELGEADAETLAGALGLDRRAGALMLNACVATGLLEKTGESYRNSADTAAFLVSSSPSDLSKAIRYKRDVYPVWGKLAEMIRKGGPLEAPQLHLGDDAERTRTFVMSMHQWVMSVGKHAVPQFRLEGRRHVLDVGGGPGTYSILIARQYPEIRCTVLDLPAVTAIADEIIRESCCSARVKTLAGDYHVTPFPGLWCKFETAAALSDLAA